MLIYFGKMNLENPNKSANNVFFDLPEIVGS